MFMNDKIRLSEAQLMEVFQSHFRRFVEGVSVATDNGRVAVEIEFKKAEGPRLRIVSNG